MTLIVSSSNHSLTVVGLDEAVIRGATVSESLLGSKLLTSRFRTHTTRSVPLLETATALKSGSRLA